MFIRCLGELLLYLFISQHGGKESSLVVENSYVRIKHSQFSMRLSRNRNNYHADDQMEDSYRDAI